MSLKVWRFNWAETKHFTVAVVHMNTEFFSMIYHNGHHHETANYTTILVTRTIWVYKCITMTDTGRYLSVLSVSFILSLYGLEWSFKSWKWKHEILSWLYDLENANGRRFAFKWSGKGCGIFKVKSRELHLKMWRKIFFSFVYEIPETTGWCKNNKK